MGAATRPLRDGALATVAGHVDPGEAADRGGLVVREIVWMEPAAAFALWAGSEGLAFLDSAGPIGERSRFSYLCVEPFRTLLCGADGPCVPDAAASVPPGDGCDRVAGSGVSLDGVAMDGDPFTVLETELRRWRLPPGAGPVPFRGGAVGLLGYGLGRWLERLPCRHPEDLGIPDAWMGFYDLVVGFDRAERRAWVMSSGLPETEPAPRAARAAARAEAALRRLDAPPKGVPGLSPDLASEWRPELDRAGYEARVREAQALIRAGDIFEVNVTMRHRAERTGALAPETCPDEAVHLALREASANPFGAFLRCGPRLALASASPERFLRLDADGWVETRPIKGTRPRGATPEADEAMRLELAASEKDRAENLMIVDLMRNDLGRVCRIGSVSVPALWGVESFSSVHHLVSVVRGRLREGLGPVDLLRATFPGGSVTGAPKIRALEVIDELESSRRGPYCGSVVAIGFDGAMDSSIVIRTLVLTPEAIVAQAGGAVVSDSDPGEEYDEMITKVSPLLRVLGG